MGQAWKALERQTAKTLGGKRNVAKGTGGPDVLDVPGWVIECKLRKSFLHHRLFREEKAKRRKDLKAGGRFALVTREGGQEALAVLTLKDYAALVQAAASRQARPSEPSEPATLRLPLEEL